MRHGFLLIDKPRGITSHDAVAIVRKILPERSVGHLGTLDPAATGLLTLAIGKKALKVVQLFADLTKEYEAQITLGKISSTYDQDGIIEDYPIGMGWNPPDRDDLEKLIRDRLLGRVSQVPPAYSALKISGERAYRKARQGRSVELQARDVRIDRCDVLSYDYPALRLLIRCGSGTYIRSIAHDLGKLLMCGGYLSGLRRTKVGEWSVKNAKISENVKWTDVIPLKGVLKDFPRRDLTEDDFEELRYGRNIEGEVAPNTIGWHQDLPVALLVQAPDGTMHAKKVF